MKPLFFIQLRFSQDSLNKKMTDTITIDNKFIKQLDDNCNRKKPLYISPFNFKLDSTKLDKNNKTYRLVSYFIIK